MCKIESVLNATLEALELQEAQLTDIVKANRSQQRIIINLMKTDRSREPDKVLVNA